MGERTQVALVKLICGMIAADESLLNRGEAELEKLFGAIDLQSEIFQFDFTDYYRAEMGERLLRKFVAFSALIDPANLARIKIQTNEIERKLAAGFEGNLKRTLNLDPGYVTQSKLVLATTKNFSHRIYLRDGIYAEVTLGFKKGGCRFFEWTYPDFKSGKYTPFFLDVRHRAPLET